MLEDSVESFMQQWREAAVEGTAYARFEGSPLLEVQIAGTVMQLFERTGPYAAPPGPVRLIVHAVTDSWSTPSAQESAVAVTGPGRFAVVGRVVRVQGRLLWVDAGFPLVLGLDTRDSAVALPREGEFMACDTVPPAHAFVLPRPNAQRITLSADDQV